MVKPDHSPANAISSNVSESAVPGPLVDEQKGQKRAGGGEDPKRGPEMSVTAENAH